jgi:hypothetical protein
MSHVIDYRLKDVEAGALKSTIPEFFDPCKSCPSIAPFMIAHLLTTCSEIFKRNSEIKQWSMALSKYR